MKKAKCTVFLQSFSLVIFPTDFVYSLEASCFSAAIPVPNCFPLFNSKQKCFCI